MIVWLVCIWLWIGAALCTALYISGASFRWRLAAASILWPLTFGWCVQRYVRGVL